MADWSIFIMGICYGCLLWALIRGDFKEYWYDWKDWRSRHESGQIKAEDDGNNSNPCEICGEVVRYYYYDFNDYKYKCNGCHPDHPEELRRLR
jgi:hypothetical protein